MVTLEDHLASFHDSLSAAPNLYVGFSGGLDSMVLLHLLSSSLGLRNLTAIHINHGLSPHSDEWSAFCQRVSAQLDVAFMAERVRVNPGGEGLEQAARTKRYAVFEKLLGVDDKLLLAHHCDDQVETVLYRLLRGSGPKGLAGIPKRRSLGRGEVLRPLLGTGREEILKYAQYHGLTWIDDESNSSVQFDRNFLRHQVIPALAQRWPDYRQRINRTAEQNRASQVLLEEIAAEDLACLDESKTRDGWRLDLPGFSRLSIERRCNLLRYWLAEKQLQIPGYGKIRMAAQVFCHAAEDAQPEIAWPGAVLRRYRQWLYLCLGNVEKKTQPVIAWSRNDLNLPDGSVLSLHPSRGHGLQLNPSDQLEVRFRKGGEQCHPSDRSHHASLKKIFQEKGVEPWLRERIPLVYVNGELAAVGDLFVCTPFAIDGDQPGYGIQWTRPENT